MAFPWRPDAYEVFQATKILEMREYASFIEMKYVGARGTAARGEGRKTVWHRM